MTDNKARSTSRVKELLSPRHGSLSRVSYQFTRKGLILLRSENQTFEQLFEQIVNLGVDDVEEGPDGTVKVVA